MKKITFYSFALLLAVTPVGCGLANSYYLNYDFEKNVAKETTVGSEMIAWNTVYKNDVYGNVLSTFKQSLTYSGKQGSVLKILYREESNGYARPAFSQELTYDIDRDSIITFKKTRLGIVDATTNYIRFIVFECPAFEYKSGEKIPADR